MEPHETKISPEQLRPFLPTRNLATLPTFCLANRIKYRADKEAAMEWVARFGHDHPTIAIVGSREIKHED
jgi:hypothetical protein